MHSFSSRMFTTVGPRAGAASHPGTSATAAAPTRTATAVPSTYSTGLSFQAPKSGAPPHSSAGTFTVTTASVQTGLDGKLTTVPLTIISTGISLVPAVTTSQSLPLPESTDSYETDNESVIIAVILGSGAILLIVGIILCLFLRNRRRRRAFYSSQSQLADAEQSFSTRGPQPSILQALGCRRRRSTKATEIPAAERPESPKETNNPFDDSNANRESWELHVDRHQTQEHRLSYNTVSTRQLYISNQVNRAREKVAELEAMSTLLRSSTMSSRGSGSRPGSEITATRGRG
ncbi:hypothetical protein B0H14DRAFT_3154523 [Mycena olivaceomarginata]|nr:hypothetical protein B0H14DRAFT_3154523 [Mycena olivaceomarginata]